MTEIECDICHSEFTEDECINLGCCHSYCMDCTIYYVKLGGPTRKLTFNHLYCPYRCGNSFQSCIKANRNRELRTLINDQVALMNKVHELAVKLASESITDETSPSQFRELLEFGLSKFSFYICDHCENVFGEEEVCCAASSDESVKEYLCVLCKKSNYSNRRRGQSVSPAIAVWRDARRERNILFNQLTAMTASTDPIICNSDHNAAEQTAELEVIMSMYPDDIEVLTPPPMKAGQPSAAYLFKLPVTQHVSPEEMQANPNIAKFLIRCMSQIRITFKATEGYPTLTPPQIYLQIGDLSMLEFNSHLKRALSNALQLIVSQNHGEACAFACFAAVIDWMDNLRQFEEQRLQEECKQQLVAKRKLQIENEKGYWRLTKEFCKRSGSCVQCARCSFGPVFHDRCLDLTEYHSLALNSRVRIDNSCPSCGWFAVYWSHWSPWDGKFLFEREQLLAGRESAAQPLSKAASARQERQNLNCLVASLRAHAKQCGSCGYGPVLHQFCDMLGTHQGEKVRGGHINNSCPSCGWFANSWSEWKPWSGKFGAIKPAKSKVGDDSQALVVVDAIDPTLIVESLETSTASDSGSAVPIDVSGDNIFESIASIETIAVESTLKLEQLDVVTPTPAVIDGIKDVAI